MDKQVIDLTNDDDKPADFTLCGSSNKEMQNKKQSSKRKDISIVSNSGTIHHRRKRTRFFENPVIIVDDSDSSEDDGSSKLHSVATAPIHQPASLTLENDESLGANIKLSWEQKQQIYVDARRPVYRLKERIKELQFQRHRINNRGRFTGLDREFRMLIEHQLSELEKTLSDVKRDAADHIYNLMNSIGHMGFQNAASSLGIHGEASIDMHALHVDEAIFKIKERIIPVLPNIKNLLLITGRGKHSTKNNTNPPLRTGIQRYLKDQPNISWERTENDGVIRVMWTGN